MPGRTAVEVQRLRERLADMMARAGLGLDDRALISEALEELAVVIEEMMATTAELIASRDALEQERSRYAGLFETLPDGYVVTDRWGMVREANATVCGLAGTTRERLVGKPLSVLITTDDQRAYYAHLDRVRNSAAGTTLSVDLKLRDHPFIPVELRTTVAHAERTEERRLRWLVHDRRQGLAVEGLRESEERLRALFESAPVGVVLTDGAGLILYSNAEAQRCIGRSGAGSDLQWWLAAMEPQDQLRVQALVRDTLDGGRRTEGVRGLRARFPAPAAEVRWADVAAAPVVGHDGATSGLVVTIRDVTVEQQAVMELQASRDFATAVLDTAGALVVVVDPDLRIQTFNAACEQVSGRRAADVVGRALLEELIPADQRQRVGVALREVIETGSPNSVENDWISTSGGRRRIQWTNTLLHHADGSVRAVVGTGTDITESRRMAAQLLQAQKMEAVGRLAGGIAHDVNNLLTVMSLRLGRIAARHEDPDTTMDIGELGQVVSRTASIIADLLAFGRQQRLEPTSVDINAEVRQVAAMVEQLLGDAVSVELELAAAGPVALVDRGRLDVILMNLALNARDAMPQGGRITIGTSVEPDPPAMVRIDVTDTGVGISDEDLSSIFDPYFTTKERGHGTGFGLAVTHGIVSQSGGTITVESHLAQGTTFTVRLPLVDVEATRTH